MYARYVTIYCHQKLQKNKTAANSILTMKTNTPGLKVSANRLRKSLQNISQYVKLCCEVTLRNI